MKPSKVKETIRMAYEANEAVFVSGPPGVGKSAVIAQLAKEMGIGFIDERMLQRDPVDVRGLPQIIDGETVWSRPDFLPTEGKGILFLDELNAAPPLVQAACYQLIHDRKIGNHTLPEGWLPIGAGNREKDRAVVARMPSALANRFTHIDFEFDLDEWISWAVQNNIRPELIAFLRWRPEMLNNFDPKKNIKAFATPRTNEKLSRYMDVSNGDLDYELACGVTGEAHATEFIGFLRIFKSLPDPDFVLSNPEQVSVPTDPATLYALCGALAHRATKQIFKNLVAFANRLSPEFSVLLIRDSIERDKGLVSTEAFIQWSAKHADVLI